MTDIKLNYCYYIAIFGSISLVANEYIMLNWIISIKKQYLKLLNCKQIEVIASDNTTLNHLTH